MLKPVFTISLSALMMTACGPSEKSPLLEGHINVAEPAQLTVVYDINGDMYNHEIMTDSAGTFVFNEELAAPSADIAIYTGHNVYGAFVENGKSVKINIDGDNVTFDGDNIDRNNFVNAYEQAYSAWKFKPTPDHPFNYDEFSRRLKNGYTNASDKLAAVADDEARMRYNRLNEARNAYYTMVYLRMRQMMDGVDASAQIDSIIAAVDPNGDEARLSGLLPYWVQENLYKKAQVRDASRFFPMMFAVVDSALTNEGNKKSLYLSLGQGYLSFQPGDSLAKAFMAEIEPYIANAPKVKESFDEILEAQSKIIKDGDAIPANPVLIAPDGSKTTLKDELQGKTAYIDFWATWCGPCCAEIPHLEKVVETLKGDDDIRIISVSIDEDRDAWLEKIKNDNPQWPQFILDQATGKEFIEAMSLHSIPRFVIIGRGGKFVSANAIRPSNKDIVNTLRSVSKVK